MALEGDGASLQDGSPEVELQLQLQLLMIDQLLEAHHAILYPPPDLIKRQRQEGQYWSGDRWSLIKLHDCTFVVLPGLSVLWMVNQ